MEVVIDIDENIFTRLFDNGTEDYGIRNDDIFDIARSIRNGTPLPKGHGDLIDAKCFVEEYPLAFVRDVINDAQVIIKADKTDKTENEKWRMTKEQKDKICKTLIEDRNYYAKECESHIVKEQGKIMGADYILQRFLDILKTEVEP